MDESTFHKKVIINGKDIGIVRRIDLLKEAVLIDCNNFEDQRDVLIRELRGMIESYHQNVSQRFGSDAAMLAFKVLTGDASGLRPLIDSLLMDNDISPRDTAPYVAKIKIYEEALKDLRGDHRQFYYSKEDCARIAKLALEKAGDIGRTVGKDEGDNEGDGQSSSRQLPLQEPRW